MESGSGEILVQQRIPYKSLHQAGSLNFAIIASITIQISCVYEKLMLIDPSKNLKTVYKLIPACGASITQVYDLFCVYRFMLDQVQHLQCLPSSPSAIMEMHTGSLINQPRIYCVINVINLLMNHIK